MSRLDTLVVLYDRARLEEALRDVDTDIARCASGRARSVFIKHKEHLLRWGRNRGLLTKPGTKPETLVALDARVAFRQSPLER